MHRLLHAPLLLLLLAGALSACSSEEAAPPPPPVRPVKTLLIEGPEVGGVRSFPGRIEASRRAELSFRVAGKLAEIRVAEGQQVGEGELLARLDPTDYQIALNDRQAVFDRAAADFERGRQLVGKGTISRRDFDALTANFKSAEAALQAAQQELAYTRLEAPFSGVVARRHVDNFEEVQARATVLSLNDTSTLEVKVDLPEALMQRIRRVDPDAPRAEVYATFDAAPGQRFPLTFKEVATRADPETQTFEATLTMAPPAGLTVLSGMTTTVVADLSRIRPSATEPPVYAIPASAAVGDPQLEPSVWIYDAASQSVQRRPVRVEQLTGDTIQVSDGLQPGDRVVVAGAAYLAEGMRVRLLPDTEQPARGPR
ncbi:MAG TPA: efflux RND transporter periplasmic adaptor subunit [Gammaproteobacteria bacterium]